MKIIIADDDSIIREGLKMIISSQPDFEVTGVACNGAEAVELCRKYKTDIALLDIRMPVMDGIEAAKIMLEEKTSSTDGPRSLHNIHSLMLSFLPIHHSNIHTSNYHFTMFSKIVQLLSYKLALHKIKISIPLPFPSWLLIPYHMS